jgi:hypothetical protein
MRWSGSPWTCWRPLGTVRAGSKIAARQRLPLDHATFNAGATIRVWSDARSRGAALAKRFISEVDVALLVRGARSRFSMSEASAQCAKTEIRLLANGRAHASLHGAKHDNGLDPRLDYLVGRQRLMTGVVERTRQLLGLPPEASRVRIDGLMQGARPGSRAVTTSNPRCRGWQTDLARDYKSC